MNHKLVWFCLIAFSLLSNNLSAQAILIFGGDDHKVFLGCLNCDKFSSNSIWNTYGNFGSKFNNTCIWNKFGDYGGKYGDQSPFNKYASHPPVLVDNDGNFFGYFTADKFKDKRTDSKLALFIIDYWEAIIEDPGSYYDKIFKK
jgi:hypothetical protein